MSLERNRGRLAAAFEAARHARSPDKDHFRPVAPPAPHLRPGGAVQRAVHEQVRQDIARERSERATAIRREIEARQQSLKPAREDRER